MELIPIRFFFLFWFFKKYDIGLNVLEIFGYFQFQLEDHEIFCIVRNQIHLKFIVLFFSFIYECLFWWFGIWKAFFISFLHLKLNLLDVVQMYSSSYFLIFVVFSLNLSMWKRDCNNWCTFLYICICWNISQNAQIGDSRIIA